MPTIGASKDVRTEVATPFKGFAMLGFKNSKNRKIRLYDAEKVKEIPISPEAFRDDFKAILYRK